MYTETDREELLNQITKYMYSAAECEGLLQIGSGSFGYTDIYSDVDLMAGYVGHVDLPDTEQQLIAFFHDLGAVYIDRRRWSGTAWGLSVYFESGLSADLSYMPTDEICIRSPFFKILFSKTMHFSDMLKNSSDRSVVIDDSIHHRFIYALRRCEIAICRSEFVYADMALSEARQYLLLIEAAREEKKLHQFKSFNSLAPVFLEHLERTYPLQRDAVDLRKAKDKLLSLYLDTVKLCDFLEFDDTQLKLLNRFE